jgi:hypothetical protein
MILRRLVQGNHLVTRSLGPLWLSAGALSSVEVKSIINYNTRDNTRHLHGVPTDCTHGGGSRQIKTLCLARVAAKDNEKAVYELLRPIDCSVAEFVIPQMGADSAR